MDLCLGTTVSVCYLTYKDLCVCGKCVSMRVCVSVSSLCVCVLGPPVSAWPLSAPGKVAVCVTCPAPRPQARAVPGNGAMLSWVCSGPGSTPPPQETCMPQEAFPGSAQG